MLDIRVLGMGSEGAKAITRVVEEMEQQGAMRKLHASKADFGEEVDKCDEDGKGEMIEFDMQYTICCVVFGTYAAVL